MANDNQTALMMSIQRKKDRIKKLESNQKTWSPKEPEHGAMQLAINILVELITEDEKLLAVDREQHENTWIMAGGSFSLFDEHYEKYNQ